MTHGEAREMLEARVLGALDDADRRALDEHLATCDDCTRELAALERLAEVLPDALVLAAPSRLDPALRSRLVRAIALRPWWRRPPAVIAAITLVLLAGSLAWGVSANTTLAQERAFYARLAGQQEIVFEVVDSPRAMKLFLRPPFTGSSAYGKVFTHPDMPFVVAMAARLPAPPGNADYHVWLTLDTGETVLAGVFDLDRNGFASLVYEAGQNGPVVQSARVTVQPRGGHAPEGVPVLISSR
jgi:hypothetical protein